MSMSIRNDKYDLFVEQAYLFYDIKNSPQNYNKVIDYAFRLSILSSINRLFSITFYNPSDSVLIEDISLMTIQSYQYIIHRILSEAGSNVDEHTMYVKYMDNIQDVEYLINTMRKLVYDHFIANKERKFRLPRQLDFHIKINSE